MTYGKRHSNEHITARTSKLGPKWERLRRSRAPCRQKLSAVPVCFWASGLHGTAAVRVPKTFVSGLRAQATLSLGLRKAGSNAMLRLSLSTEPKADPGYYLLTTAVLGFRRLLLKDPCLLPQWEAFMAQFQGTLRDGPFHVLLQRLNEIQWVVDPPYLTDQDGITLDLLEVDPRQLEYQLLEGWLQHVARTAMTRPSMQANQTLDPCLAYFDQSRHTALEQSLISALQSGCFLSPAAQAKFDLSKQALCPHCQMRNDHEHWTACAGYARHYPDGTSPPDLPTASRPLRAHLLSERNPFAPALKHYLHGLPDLSNTFHSVPSPSLAADSAIQHLFTDGACRQHPDPWQQRAAWAVLNSTTGLPIASGPVLGLWQTIDRGELWAIKAALAWAAHYQAAVYLWCDSKFTVDSLQFLLEHDTVPARWENQDLWQDIHGTLLHLSTAPQVRWIPSHLDANRSEDAFMDWFIRWNQAVDYMATRENSERGSKHASLLHDAGRWYERQLGWLRTLTNFYTGVALATRPDMPSTPETTAPPEPNSFETSDFVRDRITDLIPLQWEPVICTYARWPAGASLEFVSILIRWITQHEDPCAALLHVSFVELLFMLLGDRAMVFPRVEGGRSVCRPLDLFFTKPTIAELLAHVTKATRGSLALFHAEHLLLYQLDRCSLGITMPLAGVLLGIPPTLLAEGHRRLLRFTSVRPISNSASLARPPPEC